MSSCRRRTTVTSELPQEVKERILECMSTRDAARSSLLSTQWREAWYRQGQLFFDSAFFRSLENMSNSDNDSLSIVSIINNILILRAGPLKKFKLQMYYNSNPLLPKQSDLDRWCLYMSRNGIEELDLSMSHSGPKYKVPSCLVSCNTIKQLKLDYFDFYLPVDASCIFPRLTYLDFRSVEFFRGSDKFDKRLVFTIPKLEKLGLYMCSQIKSFAISAPKLKSLTEVGFECPVGSSRLLKLHLTSIVTLRLLLYYYSARALAVASSTFPIAINLQEIILDAFDFSSKDHLTYAGQLFKKSPKLCVLEIEYVERSQVADPALLEDLMEADFRMLETVKLDGFRGSEIELCLVKLLLSKSPALHDVVIYEARDIDSSMASEAPKKLLSFPRASPKAQIVYK
ncbi:unnamed protein product [Cuscuta epithymum]|uniref:F-box domain-containing protein n=1 Tax=Cuscuta epithymum TaxID=186058 RepID=A0AAV0DCH3_9ASTE|nr:unnamed protein product [Cuscuta epithymum]